MTFNKSQSPPILPQSLKWVLIAFAILLVSCSTTKGHLPLQDVWGNYQDAQQNKAFAIGSNSAYGASWNQSTSKQAIKVALKHCVNAGGVDCRVTHLNDKPHDKQQGRTAQEIWRLYETFHLHKAYASGKNGMAGASYGFDTSEEAVKTAIIYCAAKGGVDCRVTDLDGKPYGRSNSKNDETIQPEPIPAPATVPTLASTGTGFFLSAKGQIITNAHVVDECRFSRILYQDKAYDVSLLEVDQRNDLALLQGTIAGFKTAQLEIDRIPRLGESVVAFGYPLSSVLSSKPKITDGILSSTAGLNDDSRYFQISTPIQPGNSGGPLLDKFGRVIGIVTAKLDDSWSIENTGSIPQNVNFAIKAIVIKAFLDSNNIVINRSKQAPRQMSLPDIAEAADLYTVQVGCFK